MLIQDAQSEEKLNLNPRNQGMKISGVSNINLSNKKNRQNLRRSKFEML